MEIYMKYKLFVGQSQPNVKIMLSIHSHRTKKIIHRRHGCGCLCLDSCGFVIEHSDICLDIWWLYNDCKRKLLYEKILHIFSTIFYRKNLLLYRAALLRWHHWNLKALSLVECRKNMVGLPHNDCYRTCTTPTSTQSGTNSSLTLKMKHHSVKARPTALKNNMTVWFTLLFVLNMGIQQH